MTASTSFASIIKTLQQDSAVILKNLFTAEQVKRLPEDTDLDFSRVQQGIDHCEESLRLFYGSKTKTLSDLTSVSSMFRQDFLDHDLLHQICEAIFVLLLLPEL